MSDRLNNPFDGEPQLYLDPFLILNQGVILGEKFKNIADAVTRSMIENDAVDEFYNNRMGAMHLQDLNLLRNYQAVSTLNDQAKFIAMAMSHGIRQALTCQQLVPPSRPFMYHHTTSEDRPDLLATYMFMPPSESDD